MRLSNRVVKLEQKANDRARADQFDFINAVPVYMAEGKPPGLYRDGGPGSTGGLLVFDPAKGKPIVPEGKVAPWGMVIIHDHEPVKPATRKPGKLCD
jgi:hypothetical protein